MNATHMECELGEGVIRRFYLENGSLLQLRHKDGFTEAVLYWCNMRTKPKRVERSSERYQSLVGAIAAVLETAGLSYGADEIAAYVRSTHWGQHWPT